MATTIQISEELLQILKQHKLYDKESYEEVIWNIIEDNQEISEQTKEEIKIARKEIAEGKGIKHSEVKKRLGI